MKILCELLIVIVIVIPVRLVSSQDSKLNSNGKTDFSNSDWQSPPPSPDGTLKFPPLVHKNGSKLVIRKNVFNGEFARKRVPFLAAIVFVQNGHGAINCAGSIVDIYHILTAAHCISSYIFRTEIWIAPFDLDNFDGQRIRPSRYTIHPLYKGREGHFWYDIAIIKLAEPIQQNQFGGGETVCVGTGNYDNRPVVVAGFGKYDGVHTSRKLRKANGIAFGKTRCISAGHPPDLLDSQICARLSTSEGEAAESGGGDSGGPLYTTVHSQSILVGIVSYGYEFQNQLPNLNMPGTYTLAGDFRDFIRYFAPHTKFCNNN